MLAQRIVIICHILIKEPSQDMMYSKRPMIHIAYLITGVPPQTPANIMHTIRMLD